MSPAPAFPLSIPIESRGTSPVHVGNVVRSSTLCCYQVLRHPSVRTLWHDHSPALSLPMPGYISNKNLKCVGDDVTEKISLNRLRASRVPSTLSSSCQLAIRSPSRNRFSTAGGGLVNRAHPLLPFVAIFGDIRSPDGRTKSSSRVLGLNPSINASYLTTYHEGGTTLGSHSRLPFLTGGIRGTWPSVQRNKPHRMTSSFPQHIEGIHSGGSSHFLPLSSMICSSFLLYK